MSVECTCLTCSKSFTASATRIRWGGGKYCSKQCRAFGQTGSAHPRWTGQHGQHTCLHCGIQLTGHKTQYCSPDCRTAYTTIEQICSECGKPFRALKAGVRKGGGKWCSQSCKSKSQLKGSDYICKSCGKTFYVSQANEKRGQTIYCSTECYHDARKTGELRTCPVCGKPFYASAHTQGTNEGIHCSAACMRIDRRKTEAVSRQNYGYYQWRKAVMQRDNNTCQHCGQQKGRLVAHHIKPWRTHPELRHDVSNGMTLCNPCHAKTTNHEKTSQQR